MKKAASFLLLFTIIFASSANAQTRQNTWFEAHLKLMDGSSLKGEANYNIRNHVVQVKVADQVYTYSESQVKEMRLTSGENHHHFMLVALRNEVGYVGLNLVEMIYQSDKHFSLVRRHDANSVVVGTAPMSVGEAMVTSTFEPTQEVPANLNKDSFRSERNALSRREVDRLVINYEGTWKSLRRKSRKNLFELLEDEKKDIKSFIMKNPINLNNDEDVVKVLKEYERLKTLD